MNEVLPHPKDGLSWQIDLVCPTCQKPISAPPQAIGKKGRCPGCKSNLEIGLEYGVQESPILHPTRERSGKHGRFISLRHAQSLLRDGDHPGFWHSYYYHGGLLVHTGIPNGARTVFSIAIPKQSPSEVFDEALERAMKQPVGAGFRKIELEMVFASFENTGGWSDSYESFEPLCKLLENGLFRSGNGHCWWWGIESYRPTVSCKVIDASLATKQIVESTSRAGVGKDLRIKGEGRDNVLWGEDKEESTGLGTCAACKKAIAGSWSEVRGHRICSACYGKRKPNYWENVAPGKWSSQENVSRPVEATNTTTHPSPSNPPRVSDSKTPPEPQTRKGEAVPIFDVLYAALSSTYSIEPYSSSTKELLTLGVATLETIQNNEVNRNGSISRHRLDQLLRPKNPSNCGR